MSLEVNLSLCLPTDEASVPVVRHICSYALDEVGVRRGCVSDISLALTEACTNVLDHVADGGSGYEVHIGIDDDRCSIRVKDKGAGFDHEATSAAAVDLTAESGRGLSLIRALVDRVQFTSVPEGSGTVVHLEKELEFDDDHPVRRRTREPIAAD